MSVHSQPVKTILLMRHAKADLLRPGQKDFDRPLSERGLHDAARMGKVLRSMKSAPDVIVASPARRAKETAEAVAKALGHEGAIQFEKALYAASGEAWIEALRALAARSAVALVVAHSPGVEDAVALLVGAPSTFLDCPTAGIVAFEAPVATWKRVGHGKAMLRWFLRPKQVESIE
jgi:phosphohistidine phosphatase